MNYDSYKNKVIKFMKFRLFIKKHLAVILSSIILLVGTLTAFFTTFGMIIKDIDNEIVLNYGDEFNPHASSLFTKISYEFSDDGEEWDNDVRLLPGNYKVRCVSHNLFGNNKYGKTSDLTINNRQIDIKAKSDKITYGDEVIPDSNLPKNNHFENIEFNVEKINKNKIKATPIEDSIVILDNENNNVTQFFDINVKSVELDVLKRPITFKTLDYQKDYDGSIIDYDEFEISNGSLAYDNKVEANFENSSLSNIGHVLNRATFKIYQNDNDVTDYYDIDVEYGELQINKRPIKIKSSSKDLIYNGMNQYVREIASSEGLLSNHHLSIKKASFGKNVGQYQNKLECSIRDEHSKDVSNFYDITYIDGLINIYKRAITFESKDINIPYGDELVLGEDDYLISNGSLAIGHRSEATFLNKNTGIGSVQNKINVNIYDQNNDIVNDNYDIKFNYGTLTIAKRKVIINTGTVTKQYDGKPLFDESFTNSYLLPGDTLNIVTRPEIVDFGTIDNDITFVILNADGKDVSDKYDIDIHPGQLSISKKPIVVHTSNITKEYDGKPTYVGSVDPIEGLIENQQLVPEGNLNSITNIGTLLNKFNFKIIDSDGLNKSDNYSYDINYGNINIERRNISIETFSGTKKYDGLPFGMPNYRISEGSLVGNHYANAIHKYESFVEPGKHENKNEFQILDENGNNMTDNYNINLVIGVIDIRLITVHVYTGSASKQYDGLPLTSNEFRYDDEALLKGHRFEYNITGTQTEIGISSNNVDVCIKDSNGIDVTKKYYFIVKDLGNLYVYKDKMKEAIFVAPVNVYREYTGETFSSVNDISYNVSSNNLVNLIKNNNYTFDIVTKGEGTEIGVYPITIESFTLYDENKNDVTDNFIIHYKDAILSISSEVIIITTGSAKKLYDGTPLVFEEYVPVKLKYKTHKLDVKFTGYIINVGTVPNSCEAYVFDENGKDVTNLYQIFYEYGNLTIYLTDSKYDPDTPIEEHFDGSGDIELSDKGSLHYVDLTDDLNSIYQNEKIKSYVNSEVGSNLYLKSKSFGDYTHRGFKEAPQYKLKEGYVNPAYFPGLAIANSNASSKIGNFEMHKEDNISNLMPYYLVSGQDFTSDTYPNFKEMDNYSFKIADANYSELQNYSLKGTIYESQEKEYSKFVKENYLSLPKDTEIGLKKIINEYKLNEGDILTNVTSFLTGSFINIGEPKNYPTFEYNSVYRKYPLNADIVLYFLNTSREGVCQHFAASGVCLLRALGIPARYTIGRTVSVVPNQKSNINFISHAWVEAYIDGVGWVCLEVTGSGFSGFHRPADNNELVIKPVDVDKEYDGTPLFAKNEIEIKKGSKIDQLFTDNHYSYEVTVLGSQVDYGESISTIKDFKIFNQNGEDITGQFTIIKRTGKIMITKPQIVLTVKNYKHRYDGKQFNFTKEDVLVTAPSDVNVDYKISGTSNKIGTTLSSITDVIVTNKSGIKVNDDYFIKIENGICEVTRLELKLTTASCNKKYDGTPLEKKEYWISYGQLLPGHHIEVDMNDSITEIGSVYNTIDNYRILDNEGNDVKYIYKVTVNNGILVVE